MTTSSEDPILPDMILTGREIALSGRFGGLEPGEAERRLEAAGALVTDLSPSVSAFFAGREASRDIANKAFAQGIPSYDEVALLAVLAAAEGTAKATPAPGVFPDHAAGDPGELETVLANADWSSFVAVRDLVPLRDRLTGLEHDHGVTPAHRIATERIYARGTTSSRPCAHVSEITAVALSPSGSHLATGEWGEGNDGTVGIWELATGRCVNSLTWIDGGVGRPGHADAIQWSADGTTLGMAFRTNSIGAWDAFGCSSEPRAVAQVTNGAPRPPAWALHPDGRSGCVSGGTSDGLGVQAYLPPLGRGELHWLADTADVPHEHILPKGPLPEEIRRRCAEGLIIDQPPVWSADGSRLYAANRADAFVVDIDTGNPRWHTRVAGLAGWSPDKRFLAHVHRKQLYFRDAATGDPVGAPVPFSGSRSTTSLRWGRRGATARLAVVRDELAREPGVDVFDEAALAHRLDLTPAATPGGGDFAVWAWAPSGDRAAVLTAAGVVEVWSLGDGEPRRVRTLSAPAGTKGVWWGAGGVVVAAGADVLRFLRADTGDVVGDYRFPSEDGADAGASIVDRRFAWPRHW